MARSAHRSRAWLLPSLVLAGLASALLAQSGTPAVSVFRDTVPVPLNGTVAFGGTPVGVASPVVFTVTNTGGGTLLVSEAVSVPTGFTLMASLPGVPNGTLPTNVPAYSLAGGQSATFTVALNSATAGAFSGGEVAFQTNDPTKTRFAFRVTGTALPPPGVRYADDNDPAFTFTSGWTQNVTTPGTSGRLPFQRALSRASAGTGTETATWSFTGLEPGDYAVAATWVGYSWAATNAPFTVCDDTTPLGTVRVNQQSDAGGSADGASAWQDLGTFTITGSRLAVKLTDDANGAVFADAVRVTRVGYPGGVIDDSSGGDLFTFADGSWQKNYAEAGNKSFQRASARARGVSKTTPTARARWTFTVAPGAYRVLAGYYGYSWAATNSPFRVYDKTILLATRRVNQRVTPADQGDGGVGWADLGFYTVTSNSLVVELGNDSANGWVNADAVRVERVNTPTTPSAPDTVRLLEQATWGPTPALIDAVRAAGFSAWLDGQFSAAATSYPLLPLYNTNNNVTNDNTTSCYGDPTVAGNPARSACVRDNYSMYPLQNRLFVNALYGEDQLRQRVAWALHKIWVVSGVDLSQPSWVAPYLRILSDEALDNYRSLMYKITLSAAMGNYLDMAGSSRVRPNENYPRELMQLFTVGLEELNPDGSRKLSGGLPIPTYDQTLVTSMTKVFTGWNFAPRVADGIPNYIDPMRLNGAATENPTNHDFTSKALLRGFVQPARASSVANAYLDLNEGLDNIYNHPNVGPFVVKQLIQQLVTSNPSAGYVARVVDVFNRNKANANQMREVARAILLDPEARGDRKNADNYGHLKEPVLYVASLARLFDPKSADRTANSDGYLNPDATNLGQDAFRPASVFSYFSPFKVAVGGSPPVLGPEFQIQTTSTVLRRANFVNQSVAPNSGRTIDVIRAAGTTPSGIDPVTGQPLVPTGPAGTSLDLSPLYPLAATPSALVDQLNGLMMHGAMSAEMKADLVTAVAAVAATNAKKRVRTAVYLIASSSQYQVQK
jgi:uncharacterized protein (DUF1800 family)